MPRSNYLVWIDLEMTGLNPERDTILEIATIVTDNQLNIVEEGPNIAIHHSRATLENMDLWCKTHHTQSGLLSRVESSSIDMAKAETLTLNFIRRFCPRGASPLCGNSVHQDRRFLCRYMPTLEAYLHYRNIDVSTIKELAFRWYRNLQLPPKRNAHLALDDIRESIEELRFYKNHIFRSPTEL